MLLLVLSLIITFRRMVILENPFIDGYENSFVLLCFDAKNDNLLTPGEIFSNEYDAQVAGDRFDEKTCYYMIFKLNSEVLIRSEWKSHIPALRSIMKPKPNTNPTNPKPTEKITLRVTITTPTSTEYATITGLTPFTKDQKLNSVEIDEGGK